MLPVARLTESTSCSAVRRRTIAWEKFTLSSAFQAAGRPLWPLLGIASRVLVVGAGGWVVIHATDAGLVGLAFVTAAGLIVYGAIMAIAFRAGAWRSAGAGSQ